MVVGATDGRRGLTGQPKAQVNNLAMEKGHRSPAMFLAADSSRTFARPMTDAPTTFVRGTGAFVDDVSLPGMLHLRVARSVYARARLVRVKGGITHADIPGTLSSVGEGATSSKGGVPHPILASGFVNYVGQPVAAVVGRTPYEAADLAQAVDVVYEPLKPVVDPETAEAVEPIHPGTKSNVLARARVGSDFRPPRGAIEVEGTFANERVVPNPMEPRGAVVDWDGSTLTVRASTQSVHSWKEGLVGSLGLPAKRIRVVQMDTGGAFGTKGGIYPEYVIAAHVAMKHRRPVKWIETRSEHLAATFQGRGARAKMKLFADRRGRILGLRADILVDAGAYGQGMGSWAPGWIGYQLTGPYAIRKASITGTAVYTNKVPLGPYRGAGRPEAAFFLERSIDLLADELKMDPVEVRKRNVSARPFTSPTELEIPAARPFLDAAVRALGYRKAAKAGPVGFSMFVLIPETSSGEGARVRVDAGRVKVWLGGNVHGQGHEAFVRTLLAEELRVPPDRVDLEAGDTSMLKEGMGSWGSRSAMMGGAALVEAARRLRQQVTKKAGKYSAKALLAGTFDAEVYHRESMNLNSFGANLVTADVDATGTVRVTECRAYYDVGRALNPAMVESQVVGGSAQAIGQVLYEGALYDENGQPLAASLADAGIPTAVEMPTFVVKLAKDRSALPHGAKGVGESPTIGVPPALVRAIERASGKRVGRTPIPPATLAGSSA